MVKVAKKEVKSLEFSNDIFGGFAELVMKNYLISFEIAMSIWKKNVEFFISQMNQLAAMQQEYSDTMKNLHGKSPFEILTLPESSFNKLTKDTMDFAQRTAESNWLFLNDCINLMLVLVQDI